MFFYIIKWTILYFILFYILHNIFLFFQKSFTTLKVKDIYNYSNKEYKNIENILNNEEDTEYENKESEIKRL